MDAGRIGRFRLLSELARGGMGVVWLAEEVAGEDRGRRVVVKELRPELREDAGMREMFADEARLAARLSHSNIVRTIDVRPFGDRPFMALELLEGATLARVTRALRAEGRNLPMALGVRVLAAVLAALHHAHELCDDRGCALGVVHRDVSPNNVFLTIDGRVKLLDFGVAKSRGRSTETRSGVLKGSVAYMTPDHVCGATIDRRADVFAAGVLLRELVTGERLWGDLDEVAILKRLVAREIPVFAPRPGVPEELRAICKKAMAVQRSERYASAETMRDAVVRWLERNDPAGSLGDLVPLLERLAAEDRARLHASGKGAEIVTLASAELVSVVDVEVDPKPIERPSPRRAAAAWASAIALAASVVGLGATNVVPDAVRHALGDRATAGAAAAAPPPKAEDLPAIRLQASARAPSAPVEEASRHEDDAGAPPAVELPPNPYDDDPSATF
jgi:serine/threonine-protein kinase